MSRTPDFLLDFHTMTGIDPKGWRAWQANGMIAVSGIRELGYALALRDFFVHRMGLQAELNEPMTEDATWGVVAVQIPAL